MLGSKPIIGLVGGQFSCIPQPYGKEIYLVGGLFVQMKADKMRKGKTSWRKISKTGTAQPGLCLPGLEIPAPFFIDGISWSSPNVTQVAPSQTCPSLWVLLFSEVLISSFDRCRQRGGGPAAKHCCGCPQRWVLFPAPPQKSQDAWGKSHPVAAATAPAKDQRTLGVKGLLEGISPILPPQGRVSICLLTLARAALSNAEFPRQFLLPTLPCPCH